MRSEMTEQQRTFVRRVASSFVFVLAVTLMFAVIPAFSAFAQGAESTRAMSPEQAEVTKYGMLAAAFAFGFGAIGAGIGIANVGAAAMGAISEKPELAGQALIFIALAEGLVVFGFITALIILGRV